jgi:hypothetical protein
MYQNKTRPGQTVCRGRVHVHTVLTGISLKLTDGQIVVTNANLVSHAMIDVFRQEPNRTIAQRDLDTANVATAWRFTPQVATTKGPL